MVKKGKNGNKCKYNVCTKKGSTMKRTPKRRDSFGEDSEDSDQEENIKVFSGIKTIWLE